MNTSTKLEANKKAIGKTVSVLENGRVVWVGQIVDVQSEDEFLVKNHEGKVTSVSIWDIRY